MARHSFFLGQCAANEPIWKIFATLLALGVSVAAQDKGPQPIKPPERPSIVEHVEAKKPNAQEQIDPKMVKDDAQAREKWFAEWFGPIAPGYLSHRQKVAEQEIQKWGNMIPGTPAHYARVKSSSAVDGAGAADGVFRNIGPHNGFGQNTVKDLNVIDTGRITVILPHPTNPRLLYVGYAGGGLWRCRNADLASDEDWVWEPLTDGLPGGGAAGNISIGSAAFKPEDPNTIYLSLGDMMPGSANSTAEGRGFFISRDGGETWTRGGALGETSRTKTVLALPGNIVLVAGNTGIYRSTDGGLSFQLDSLQPLLPPNNSWYTGWDILKLDNGDLVASVTYGYWLWQDGEWHLVTGSAIIYSTDNGARWATAARNTPFPQGNIERMSIAASGKTIYCLFQDNTQSDFRRGLLKSTDYGRTWNYQEAPTLFSYVSGDGGSSWYNHMIAVDPDDPNTVFVGTNFCVYRSKDGGQTFEAMTHWVAHGRLYTHADMHTTAWAKSGPKALYAGTDGGLSIFRQPNIEPIPKSNGPMMSNPAIIDHRRNKNISTQLVYNIACTTAETPPGSRSRILVGFQDLGTRLRLESGVATGTFNDVIGGDGFGCLIHAHNGDLMLGSYYNTNIFRSADGGNSWTYCGINDGPFYTRLFDTPADPTGNRVYTFTPEIPYVSDDFGASWTPLPTAGNGWLTGNGREYEIRSFGVSPLKLGLVGATFDVDIDGRAGRIAISEDNGTHWRTYTGFPGANSWYSMAEIAFDVSDPNIIYVTSVAFNQSANHLWKSTDRGYTWRAIDGANGFPFGVPVHVLKINPLDNKVLFAGTDVGLYRSTNQGATWARFGDGLPLVSVRDIYIAPDNSFMRLGTHGRGVWETVMKAVSIVEPLGGMFTGEAATFKSSTIGLGDGVVAWSASAGTITQQGAFTAPAAAQMVTITAASVQEPSLKGTALVKINTTSFDDNSKTAPQLLDLANAFGSTREADLDKYDFNNDGKIDDDDLRMLFVAIGW
ncbi:MAG: hypothetical protein LBC63_10880 [Holophagales bacterium]|jgi:photosystem II stability/assembly factor-like uncharacterized protein|nr:hypothetical protein [Holophagales bacterium]